MKAVSLTIQKLYANVKVFAGKTNRLMDISKIIYRCGTIKISHLVTK